jgi:hypothetical protein
MAMEMVTATAATTVMPAAMATATAIAMAATMATAMATTRTECILKYEPNLPNRFDGGVVHAWVGQKRLKRNILRRFFYRSYAS